MLIENVVGREGVGRKTYQEMSRYFLPQRKPPSHQFQMLNTVALSPTKGLTYSQPFKSGSFTHFQHLFT